MAIEDFTSTLFLDVEFSQAYYSRGNVLRRSGQFLFALSDYEKSLKYEQKSGSGDAQRRTADRRQPAK